MLLYRLVGIVLLMLSAVMQAAAADLSQPLPVRNFYPPMMRFFDPTPDSALRVYDPSWTFEVNQSLSSISIMDRYPNPQLLTDMELYVVDGVIRHALSNHLEFTMRVPVLRAFNGVFDGAIKGFHDMLGIAVGGRRMRPNNSFAYAFDNGRGTAWQGRSQWELGNIELSGRYRMIAGDGWGVAALAAVKLPSASRARGWSSGSPDMALGAVLSWRRGSWFTHTEGWVIEPLLKNEPGLSYSTYLRGSFVVGYRFDTLALIVQTQGGGSPYHAANVSDLGLSPLLVSVGLRGQMAGATDWTLSVIENVTQKTTQDISLAFGLSWMR